jgi:hypothetical protein
MGESLLSPWVYFSTIFAAASARFGAFALLPLPDVDGERQKISHALHVLGLDGITDLEIILLQTISLQESTHVS